MEEIVEKVKRGEALGEALLKEWVEGFLAGKVSREAMTDFLKAVCEFSISEADAIALTKVMLESGEVLSFKKRAYPYADKHSTGGLADSTTLIVAPLVAAAGVPFLKMSGRKLGHTGGTIDKLEKFKGLRPEMSVAEAEKVVDEVGAAVIAQSKELVPADKALYKLRDETGTVRSLPLIASSVVSKKLASGAEVFCLDVKTGDGAFMEKVEDAVALAKLMVGILNAHGKKAVAVISDMNSPLGSYIGGETEVLDALDALSGKKSRLSELSLLIAAKLIALAKNVSEEKAFSEAELLLRSGKAREKLKEIVRAEGGETSLFEAENREKILRAESGTVFAEKSGYIGRIDCVRLGGLARRYEEIGGNGIFVPFKVGDAVGKGDALAVLKGSAKAGDAFLRELRECFELSEKKVPSFPLVFEIVTGKNA